VGRIVKKRWGHTVSKHSAVIGGHSMTLSQTIGMIDADRPTTRNLSSSIRVFVLKYYMCQVEAGSGHQNSAVDRMATDWPGCYSHPDQR